MQLAVGLGLGCRACWVRACAGDAAVVNSGAPGAGVLAVRRRVCLCSGLGEEARPCRPCPREVTPGWAERPAFCEAGAKMDRLLIGFRGGGPRPQHAAIRLAGPSGKGVPVLEGSCMGHGSCKKYAWVKKSLVHTTLAPLLCQFWRTHRMTRPKAMNEAPRRPPGPRGMHTN